MHLARHIEYWAHMRGDRSAVTCEENSLTWTGFNAAANALAAQMRNMGVRRGDRIGCLLPNCLEWCITFAAASKAECLFVPLNAMFGPKELRFIAEDAGCKLVVSTPSLFAKLDDHYAGESASEIRLFSLTERASTAFDATLASGAPSNCVYDDRDPMAICYTSGTTGQPKGAVHTHASVAAMISGLSLGYGMTPDDVFLLAAPLAFTGGVICNLAVSLTLGTHLIVEPRFDPPRTLRLIAQHKVTAFGGAAIFWQRLAELPEFEAADMSSLQHGFTGGAPVTRELLEKFLRKGIGIRQAYGCTEAGGGATIADAQSAIDRPEACGRAMIGLDMELRNDAGALCAVGEVGEIRLRGPQMMQGYWNSPEKTKAAFDGDWYMTGDLGYLNEYGAVVIVDRKKNMIISGGVNVYPAEVEAALEAHASVKEAVVFGLPDKNWGEEVVAIVHGDGSRSAHDLIKDMKLTLGNYKAPKRMRFSQNPIPRTATGKIDRAQLRDLFAQLEE